MEKIFRKKEIAGILFLFLTSSLFAQPGIQYLPCLVCPSGTPAQSFKINTATDDIVSDFGRRNATGASSWHRGIDLTVSGSEDYGYHLITPVSGTVTKLVVSATGYKYIVIDGTGNQDFGYGHIFNDQSLPIVMGDLVLKQCNNISSYAIINLATGKAIGPSNGSMVTYNGINYLVSNQVQQGQVIAPLGTSGQVASHLHLYHPLNPYVDPQDVSNAKDPLEVMTHYSTSYVTSISNFYNLSKAPLNINYPGHTAGSVIVFCGMQNPGILGASPNQYYHSAVMDVDRMELFIKPKNSPVEPYGQWGGSSSAYQLFKGPNYYSLISNGSRSSSSGYPSSISGSIHGSQSLTGIYPIAYNSAPNDLWFFSDFVTRIHKNHAFGQPLQLAGIQDDARYPDGIYKLSMRLTRVTGLQVANNASACDEIRIDNFKPYIKKVSAKRNTIIDPFYVGEWQWNGNTLDFNLLQNTGVLVGNDIIVQFTVSEPMTDVKLAIGTWNYTETTPVYQTNQMEWSFHVPASALSEGIKTFRISGHDLAGNEVEGFLNTQPKPAGSFPVRISEAQWSPAAFGYEDVVHHITVLGNDPLVANFSPEFITVNPGEYVSFTDLSAGDNIQSWYWEFEEGDPPVSATQHPLVVFNSPGDHIVTLNIHNSVMSSSKSGIVTVVGDEFPPNADFSPKNVTITENTSLHFLDMSTGNPDQWYWDFDGAAPPSQLQNPEVTFSQTGIYYIIFSVMNDAGFDQIMGSITVVDEPVALDVLCNVNPFLATPGSVINLQASVLNAMGPFLYWFDFGDGTIIPVSSSSISESVSHTYLNSGYYHLTVNVKDAFDRLSSCFETVEIMGGNPCSGFEAKISMSPGNDVFSVPVNTAVTFTGSVIGGAPQYLYNWVFSQDPISGASPSVTSFTGEGPHTLMYYQPGNYPVSLHVSDGNGCASTVHANITVFTPQHCLVAKINKQINGRLNLPLGTANFWDFTFVPWCGSCQDPPGTSNFPCETNNHWKLVRYPLNMYLTQQYGNPFYSQGCALNSSLEQLFQYNFQQEGWYKLSLRAWDEDCNVASGFDCQDQTDMLIHVIDCNKHINICNDNFTLTQGYNEEIFTGYIEAGGPACPMVFLSGVDIDLFAAKEIKLSNEVEVNPGCELVLAIRPCPGSDNIPVRVQPSSESNNLSHDFWSVFPDPAIDLISIIFSEEQSDPYEISIYNLLGKKVLREECQNTNSVSLDLSDLSPGVYLVYYRSINKEKVTKIIKR
ncbi:MAG: PKD domain-containing protein [Bacteroidales bacterium]